MEESQEAGLRLCRKVLPASGLIMVVNSSASADYGSMHLHVSGCNASTA